jgi:photosystem II stability/assembly factor-like uncharacterized protein
MHWTFAGLAGNEIHSIEIDPTNPDVVYLGTSWGIYKTVDGGISWERIFETGMVTVAIHPRSPNIIYAGCIKGIYRSIDSGENWEHLSWYYACYDLAFDPEHLDRIYGGAWKGIAKSEDGGETWKYKPFTDQSGMVSTIAVDPTSPYILYAGIGKWWSVGIFKSTDHGETWTPIGLDGRKVASVIIDPNSTNRIYAGTFGKGVYRSDDYGSSWTAINSGLTDPMVVSIALDPSSPDTIYAATNGMGGVYKSTNQGDSWQRQVSGLRNTYIRCLDFDPDSPNALYAVTSQGIHKNMSFLHRTIDNGENWEPLKSLPPVPYRGINANCVAIDNNGTVYVGVYNSGPGGICGKVFKCIDMECEEIFSLDNCYVWSIAVDSITGNIYLGTAGRDYLPGIFRSIDGGKNWESVGVPGRWILSIIVNPASPNIVYAGVGQGFWRSTDYGKNWELIALPYRTIWSLAINPDNPNTLYAGCKGVPEVDGIYKSTDGGSTWNPCGLVGYEIRSLVIDPHSTNIIYAGTFCYKGVWKSIDGGVSWINLNSELPHPCIRSMALDTSS